MLLVDCMSSLHLCTLDWLCVALVGSWLLELWRVVGLVAQLSGSSVSICLSCFSLCAPGWAVWVLLGGPVWDWLGGLV